MSLHHLSTNRQGPHHWVCHAPGCGATFPNVTPPDDGLDPIIEHSKAEGHRLTFERRDFRPGDVVVTPHFGNRKVGVVTKVTPTKVVVEVPRYKGEDDHFDPHVETTRSKGEVSYVVPGCGAAAFARRGRKLRQVRSERFAELVPSVQDIFDTSERAAGYRRIDAEAQAFALDEVPA